MQGAGRAEASSTAQHRTARHGTERELAGRRLRRRGGDCADCAGGTRNRRDSDCARCEASGSRVRGGPRRAEAGWLRRADAVCGPGRCEQRQGAGRAEAS